MTSTFRTITSGFLDWRGIGIQVTYERQRFADQIQVETLDSSSAATDCAFIISITYQFIKT